MRFSAITQQTRYDLYRLLDSYGRDRVISSTYLPKQSGCELAEEEFETLLNAVNVVDVAKFLCLILYSAYILPFSALPS